MTNISFDNPYLLLLIIPALLLVIIPFFIARNSDNKSPLWTTSLIIHIVIAVLVALAAAGLATRSVLTRTTVYVVADVSYSSERNLDKIDEYIKEIEDNLPENSRLGVVCFGKNVVLLSEPGKTLRSVSEANVDNTATDIVNALSYTDGLFGADTLKRIVLITDGNDTITHNSASIASTVERLTENGVKIDAIFIDNSPSEDEGEVQLVSADLPSSAYIGHTSEVKFLVQSAARTDAMLELYQRELSDSGEPVGEFEKIDQTVVTIEGLTAVRMSLPTNIEGTYEYNAVLKSGDDISPYNNERTFTQKVVGKTKILHLTGSRNDVELINVVYGGESVIDSYVVTASGTRVPFMLEELINYDEIVLSNIDIRNVRNVNAFLDALDIVVSQYGKSLVTFGNLELQTNYEDPTFRKLQELLPVKFGNTGRDGRLYTIVLDVSYSMFMASKFTTAKDSAIKLLSILDDDDYVCLVTFSGEINLKAPARVGDCKDSLVSYIDSLSTSHGTDLAMGLEEALKTVLALNLTENQVMIISDGFSFESERSSVDVAKDLYNAGAIVSAIDTYIPADGTGGRNLMKSVVNAGRGGKYYEISRPEDVSQVVFGDMADDLGDVIIEKSSTVNIVRKKDSILNGITGLPSVSGYILSVAKYDATVPLTVSYVKDNGYQETVPLYAYRSHGNGRVASFTSSLSDSWTSQWSSTHKFTFIENLFVSNTPDERIDRPFALNTEIGEYDAYIELVPSILNPAAIASIKITNPLGRTVTRTLAFDSSKYFYTLDIDNVGSWRIELTYSYDERVYTESFTFDVPYLPEYNAFATFDKFTVYEFMRGKGSVTEDGIPSLENDKSEITTYKQSFIIPLLIAAVALFVIDILIRKLKISKKQPKGEQK